MILLLHETREVYAVRWRVFMAFFFTFLLWAPLWLRSTSRFCAQYDSPNTNWLKRSQTSVVLYSIKQTAFMYPKSQNQISIMSLDGETIYRRKGIS